MAKSDATPSSGTEVRAASRVLSVFENPLNARLLRGHRDGPQRLSELVDSVGWSAQTTIRVAIANLCKLGALTKEQVEDSPSLITTALSPAGEEMLDVIAEIEAWLGRYPDGPLAIESEQARGAVKALAGGWNSTLVRELANRPFTLTELNNLIPDFSYPSLERRISWLRTTGQIEAIDRSGRGTPYVVTDWLRLAVAPLCAAGRCEQRHMRDEASPITSVEIEGALLLIVPIVPLPEDACGTCSLGVTTDGDGDAGPALAGVTATVVDGIVTSCIPEVRVDPPSWVLAPAVAWLDMVLDGRIEEMRIGGVNPQLALELATGIHSALVGNRREV